VPSKRMVVLGQSNRALSIHSSIIADRTLSAIIEQGIDAFAVPVTPCVSRQIGNDENGVEPQRLIISPRLFRHCARRFAN